MAPFYGWVSTVSEVQNNYEETVYFLPLSSREIFDTHLTDLGRIKDWIYPETLSSFQTGIHE